ncbi:MAG: LuxR family transcriptional regulator [Pseudomonadota bacterium]
MSAPVNTGNASSTAMASRFAGFVDVAIAAANFADLRQALIDFHTASGIAMMSYHHRPPPGALDYTQQIAVAAHGFPGAWVQKYEQAFTLCDPITRHALCATESFLWSEARHFDDLSSEEEHYLEQLGEAGLGDGLAVPVFGPLGRNGYVGLGFGTDDYQPDTKTITFLQAACQLGHQRYCRMLHARQPSAVHLSPRESEILIWVARGKSNAVIADILEISGHTVDTHLRRTFTKLGVQDRVTAALRGAALGVL